MPLPSYPSATAEFLAALNGNPYDAESNPEGLAAGGHRQNFPDAMQGTAEMGAYFEALGAFLDVLATQVADDAASAAAGSGTEATAAAIRSGVDAYYMSIRRAYAAGVPVVLTDAATINWDMSSGINFDLTLAAAGRTLANATNKVNGKSGLLFIIQGSGGSRSITTWGTDYIWVGDSPVWPTTAGAISLASYIVRSDKVYLSYGGNSA